MKAITISMAFMLAVMVARPGSAQQCEGCPGDLDGNGKVTIDEIVTVVNGALGECEGLFFDEPFAGEQLNPGRWGTSLNGYPTPAVVVSNGLLQVGQPGTTALDFPYLESLALPFPASGGLELDVVMEFTSAGRNGSGIGVIGADGGSLVRIRDQTSEPSGLTINIPGSRMSGFASKGMHTYSMTFRGNAMDISVDGAPAVTNFPLETQPQRIWLGHPGVGQVFGIDDTGDRPIGVDASGTVVGRSWAEAEWSTFRIDSIKVKRLETQPQ